MLYRHISSSEGKSIDERLADLRAIIAINISEYLVLPEDVNKDEWTDWGDWSDFGDWGDWTDWGNR